MGDIGVNKLHLFAPKGMKALFDATQIFYKRFTNHSPPNFLFNSYVHKCIIYVYVCTNMCNIYVMYICICICVCICLYMFVYVCNFHPDHLLSL